MKLHAKDRLIILNILPARGNFTTMTIKKDIIDKLKITQEEIEELKLVEDNGTVKWNIDKDVEKEFKLTELEIKLIKDELSALDSKAELTDDTFNLLKIL